MPQPQNTQAITGTPVDVVLQPFTPLFRTVGWEGPALLLLMAVFILGERQKKGRLASGRRAGAAEIAKARKIAQQPDRRY